LLQSNEEKNKKMLLNISRKRIWKKVLKLNGEVSNSSVDRFKSFYAKKYH